MTLQFHPHYRGKFDPKPGPELGADARVKGPRLTEVNATLQARDARIEDLLHTIETLQSAFEAISNESSAGRAGGSTDAWDSLAMVDQMASNAAKLAAAEIELGVVA